MFCWLSPLSHWGMSDSGVGRCLLGQSTIGFLLESIITLRRNKILSHSCLSQRSWAEQPWVLFRNWNLQNCGIQCSFRLFGLQMFNELTDFISLFCSCVFTVMKIMAGISHYRFHFGNFYFILHLQLQN